MIIIYGIGNNENKYLKTKHNIGRIVVEKLASNLSLEFRKIKHCMVAKDAECLFVYSLDYVNTSGQILNDLIQFYKLESPTILLIHDDSDQFEFKQKLSLGGSSAGHNGLNDINLYLKSWGVIKDEVLRLKLGIRPMNNKQKAINFVLSPITNEDQKLIEKSVEQLTQNFNLIKTKSFSKLQNIMNTIT